MKFKVRIERDEDGWHVATVPALPGCISQGKTEAEARKNIKDAIKLHLRCLAEEGVPIQPEPHVKVVTVTVTA
ncbi:MAG: type II toxin-antitoxin system HicB family antitoxin [Candidatus Hodarchaeaceae archaeon]|nr:type II toxin-antitoxin system HicB family antitoxin [Candidatus Hodarchaeaceae archaeon]